MNISDAKEASRRIFQQLDSVQTDIAHVKTEIDLLVNRLSPIITEEIETDSDRVNGSTAIEASAPYEVQSPIARTLEDFSYSLQTLRRRLNKLNEGVEI
jgi:hypothetical protein